MDWDEFDKLLEKIVAGEITDMHTTKLESLHFLQVRDIATKAPKGSPIQEKAHILILQWALECDRLGPL